MSHIQSCDFHLSLLAGFSSRGSWTLLSDPLMEDCCKQTDCGSLTFKENNHVEWSSSSSTLSGEFKRGFCNTAPPPARGRPVFRWKTLLLCALPLLPEGVGNTTGAQLWLHILRDCRISTQPRFNKSPTKRVQSLQLSHTNQVKTDGSLSNCLSLADVNEAPQHLELLCEAGSLPLKDCYQWSSDLSVSQTAIFSLITLDNVSVSSEVIQLLLLSRHLNSALLPWQLA